MVSELVKIEDTYFGLVTSLSTFLNDVTLKTTAIKNLQDSKYTVRTTDNENSKKDNKDTFIIYSFLSTVLFQLAKTFVRLPTVIRLLSHTCVAFDTYLFLSTRTLRPLDRDTIINSVKKTSRLVTVEEGWPTCGVGAEIAAIIMEEAFDALDAPVERVSGVDVPMPYAINLEKAALPHVDHIVKAALKTTFRAKKN